MCWRCASKALDGSCRASCSRREEGDHYESLCPELDIASQGDTVEAARLHLVEALELFFESADPAEVTRRLHGEVFVTQVEVAVG